MSPPAPRRGDLAIWMNGRRVGTWGRAPNGVDELRYTAEWYGSPDGRALSRSLPLTAPDTVHRGRVVHDWFENLLPDSDAIRRRIASRFATGGTGARSLLAAIGRDCVGAVQLLPIDEEPGDVRRITADVLTDADVASILHAVRRSSALGAAVADEPDFRVSIAGAQEKTALLRRDGRWYRPTGATPTTHILKLAMGLVGGIGADMRDSVENEWLCLTFLRHCGLPVAAAEALTFVDDDGPVRALAVERFDRRPARTDAGTEWLVRLPQEDLCQATGTPPHRKYESDGGPGIVTCLDVLAEGTNADDDRLLFVLATLAFWLLAATDGHAKNFSLFLRRDGHVLTPFYDVLSAWPIIGHGAGRLPRQKVKLAMAPRGDSTHYELARIHPTHWHALARRLPPRDAWQRLLAFVDGAEAAMAAAERALPPDFPAEVAAAIGAGVRAQRRRFLDAAATSGLA